MSVSEREGEACESYSHEETAQVRGKAEFVEFEQRNSTDHEQEEGQGPGSQMHDDEIHRGNQRECGVETAEVESSGGCR